MRGHVQFLLRGFTESETYAVFNVNTRLASRVQGLQSLSRGNTRHEKNKNEGKRERDRRGKEVRGIAGIYLGNARRADYTESQQSPRNAQARPIGNAIKTEPRPFSVYPNVTLASQTETRSRERTRPSPVGDHLFLTRVSNDNRGFQ